MAGHAEGAAVDAIKALDIAGAPSFITCESNLLGSPRVVVTFKIMKDAQAFHRALIQCGMAARQIEAENQADSTR